MTSHRLAPEAIADLDAIVDGLSKRGVSWSATGRVIASITRRFFVLTQHPYLGRARVDLGVDRRSYSVGE